jgi:hypothetical protein
MNQWEDGSSDTAYEMQERRRRDLEEYQYNRHMRETKEHDELDAKIRAESQKQHDDLDAKIRAESQIKHEKLNVWHRQNHARNLRAIESDHEGVDRALNYRETDQSDFDRAIRESLRDANDAADMWQEAGPTRKDDRSEMLKAVERRRHGDELRVRGNDRRAEAERQERRRLDALGANSSAAAGSKPMIRQGHGRYPGPG